MRANPLYELVLLDRLAPAERELVAGQDGGDELYGVLRPRAGADLEPRSASTDTALLFLTLAEPAPLPEFVRARLGDDTERTIARLVVDGVLEIEADGDFVSGARAGELVLGRRGSSAGSGRIAALSTAALRYGQELDGLPESLLALRLYFYGRKPVSPRLRRELPDEHAVAARLGVVPGGSAWPEIESGWIEVPPPQGERTVWRHWRPRAMPSGRSRGRAANYKLYVSPTADALELALPAVAGTLASARGVVAFKVGRDLPDVCRPDKLVVYLDRLDDLQEAAELLRERLDGCPAHGVPFTAAVTSDGLLSWGADPPGGSGPASSWRMWVVEQLAAYLALARRSDAAGLEPWRFALERLRLSGVDTDTWVPASGMWPEALASV
ncbi:MAG: hypothetical protein M3340_03210 [Actinomycetota bacterium]|nr:hypothetical protein [Actinomycetota bacterium]